MRRTLIRVASACFAMFVRASCTIRYIVVSTSAGSRSSPSWISRSTDADTPVAVRLDQTLDRGVEPEVVESGGSQLDGEPADVMERRDDELAHGSHSSEGAAPSRSTARAIAARAGSRQAPARSRRGAHVRGATARAPAPRPHGVPRPDSLAARGPRRSQLAWRATHRAERPRLRTAGRRLRGRARR